MRKSKIIGVRILNLIVAFLMVMIFGGSAFALDGKTEDHFAASGIIFYDPEGKNPCYNLNGLSSGGKAAVIGDSITKSAEEKIKEKFGENLVFIDGEVGRNWAGGVKVLEEKESELPQIVFYLLGTNVPSSVNEEAIYKVKNLIGSDKHVVFMTTYNEYSGKGESGGDKVFNDKINKVVQDDAMVHVVDWVKVVKEKNVKMDDCGKSNGCGVHPQGDGKEFFAQAVYDVYAGISGGSVQAVSADSAKYYYKEDNGTISQRNVFTKKQLEMIQENMPVYKEATQGTNVPWQMLATVHYVENGLRVENHKNGMGLYQLYSYTHDRVKDKNGAIKYVFNESKAFRPAGLVSKEEFLKQSKLAVEVVQGKMKAAKVSEIKTDRDAKKTLFGYNGKAQGYIDQAKRLKYSDEDAESGEGSVYVMNGADEDRAANQVGNSDWRIIDISGAERYVNPGTFLIYSALAGLAPGDDCIESGSMAGGLSGDLANRLTQAVKELAWPLGAGDSAVNPKSEKYMELVRKHGFDYDRKRHGASCSVFVPIILAYIGADDSLLSHTSTAELWYLLDKSEKYVNVTNETGWPGCGTNLKHGDIRIKKRKPPRAGHIEIFAEVDGKLVSVSASHGKTQATSKYPRSKTAKADSQCLSREADCKVFRLKSGLGGS